MFSNFRNRTFLVELALICTGFCPQFLNYRVLIGGLLLHCWCAWRCTSMCNIYSYTSISSMVFNSPLLSTFFQLVEQILVPRELNCWFMIHNTTRRRLVWSLSRLKLLRIIHLFVNIKIQQKQSSTTDKEGTWQRFVTNNINFPCFSD